MATLTIKNIPDDLYQRLATRAKRNRRSLNNEAIVGLEHFVNTGLAGDSERLERVRRLRESLPDGVWLTDDILAERRTALVDRSDRIITSKARKSKTR